MPEICDFYYRDEYGYTIEGCVKGSSVFKIEKRKSPYSSERPYTVRVFYRDPTCEKGYDIDESADLDEFTANICYNADVKKYFGVGGDDNA